MATRVVLHIGAMKSGTSFIQQVLRSNRERLREQGVLFPGETWRDQVVAVRDLIDHNPQAGPPLAEDGPWRRMVAEIDRWPGTAVISMEFLGPRTRPKIDVVTASFAGTDLQVVLTARDLGRTLPSMWTESVQNRGVLHWPAYLDAVRGADTPEREVPEAVEAVRKAFWRQQRLAGMARRWSEAVGPGHFTLITVPPSGAPPRLLWERFSQVLGIPADSCDLDVPGNPSIDAASALVLRALNERIAGRVSGKEYETIVKRRLAKEGLARRPRRGPGVGMTQRWVLRRSRAEVAAFDGLGLEVVGDLEELLARPVRGADPTKVSADDQLEAALDGLAALVLQWAEQDRAREDKRARRKERKERKRRDRRAGAAARTESGKP